MYANVLSVNNTSVKMFKVVMEGMILMKGELTMTDNHDIFIEWCIYSKQYVFDYAQAFIYYLNFSANNTLLIVLQYK